MSPGIVWVGLYKLYVRYGYVYSYLVLCGYETLIMRGGRRRRRDEEEEGEEEK